MEDVRYLWKIGIDFGYFVQKFIAMMHASPACEDLFNMLIVPVSSLECSLAPTFSQRVISDSLWSLPWLGSPHRNRTGAVCLWPERIHGHCHRMAT